VGFGLTLPEGAYDLPDKAFSQHLLSCISSFDGSRTSARP
jgi:hypothetical protein